jgi:hypothetical protein
LILINPESNYVSMDVDDSQVETNSEPIIGCYPAHKRPTCGNTILEKQEVCSGSLEVAVSDPARE